MPTTEHKIYYGLWDNKAQMCKNFSISIENIKNCKILFAFYTRENYGCDGRALVLFIKNGKLYEVNGSHCSCYGLEDQWSPEETNKKALMHRLEKGNLGSVYLNGCSLYSDNHLKEPLKNLIEGL